MKQCSQVRFRYIMPICIFAGFALLVMIIGASPVQAKNLQKVEYSYSIEAGTGLNGVLPFFHAKLGWHLPLSDYAMETYLDYSFWNLGQSPAFLQLGLLGLKYYLPEMGQIYPFLGLNTGISYVIGGPVVGNPGFVDPTSMMGWVLQAGAGVDLMMNEHLGFSGALYLGYPFIVRPELNLRWVL